MSQKKPHALITGGTRGIGLELVKYFLQKNYTVTFCGRSNDSVTAALQHLEYPDDVTGVAADVRDFAAVKEFLSQACKKNGQIDVLINNAAIGKKIFFEEKSQEAMDEEIDTNLKGVLYVTQNAIPFLSAGAVVINVASGAGLYGFAGFASYSASKFGVIGFTEAMAGELTARDVYVYAICPGRVGNEMATDLLPGTVAERIGDIVSGVLPLKSGESFVIN